MKKRLEELAQGSFSCRTPELKVSEERLELKLPAENNIEVPSL